MFSLDRVLRSLPLATLYDGDRYLIETTAIGLLSSINLVDFRQRNLDTSAVMAMGASEFATQAALPAVPYEIELVSQISNGRSFLDGEFTFDRLIDERDDAPLPILHLATHAEFVEGDFANSYIQLWDRRLQLDEIRTLSLNDPLLELMVLSACQTAVGSEDAELGFAGMAVKAGIKTAIASLWYVSDTGTLGLMSQFYPLLQTAPTRAVALQRAQIAMLRGEVRIENGAIVGLGESFPLPDSLADSSSPDLTNPYYWSAFTLIGSPW